MPGSVIKDYMVGNKLPDYSIGTNVDEYKKLEGDFWIYKTEFEKPNSEANQNVVFFSKGIDYEFDILLNGKKLFHQEGMFTPVRLVLNEALKDINTLEVVVYPVPIDKRQPEGRRQALLAVKPPVPYGWDWHPRLIPLGIWDQTGIKVENKAQVLEADFNYKLNEDLSKACIEYSFNNTKEAIGSVYSWSILDQSGKVIFSKSGGVISEEQSIKLELENPNLWWSHDHGKPYQYTSQLEIKDDNGEVNDKYIQKVGFRKVELVMNEGAWSQPQGFPKGRSIAPFTIRLNNKVIFAKGSNWVHPEINYGTIDYNRYLEQLLLVKELNMNTLRIWGGGITNKESFFEICDSLGILVWQEFPLACNPYTNDEHYLEILEQEAISIIKRVRQHPSLALWSGGNELFNSWSGMDDQAHPLRLLNSLCYQLDRNTPFINTSPLYGVGHGHYVFHDRSDNLDVFQRMANAKFSAYTEFGMPSLASVNTLKKIIPKKELFPPKPTPSWRRHHAFGAWQETSWLEKHTLEKYFGKAETLEDLVWQSQIIQLIGYRAIFEEGRRQKPYCSMVLNWCLNEPWPTAANNSIIAYPNIKKMSFEGVKEALRPSMASAKFWRFDYLAGGTLEFDLWMLNDAYDEIESGHANVFLTVDGKKEKIGNWNFSKVLENKNLQGPRIRYDIPGNVPNQLAKVSIEINGNEELNSKYYIMIKSRKKEKVNVNRLNF